MKTKKIIIGISQGLLSAVMLMAGTFKLMSPYEELANQMLWAQSASPIIVKLIGFLEILGVLGMNLPFLLRKYYQLIPLAAGGLTLTMIGAIITHLVIGDNFIPPLVLLIFAGIVTYFRKNFLTGTNTSAVSQ